MAVRFHELPVEVFPNDLRPYIARLNRELRDIFGLEGSITDQRTTNRSDRTIVRREEPSVDISRVSGALSDDNPAVIGNGSSPGVSTAGSRSDHVHDLSTAGDLNYVRRDGGNTVTGDLTFASTAVGPVLVINDGSSDRTWRIVGIWNPTTGKPVLRLVEV